ncbi:hypothetical protein BDV98DRAFT_605254 [Pterulicium gracile]|uniref:DUF6534 domain-containing protein n=1 Tax=Pterulicium gracile TaxID=1884261 RepID=A0A5C3QEV4_9AGAR|nr:hypothetical protein BDV98DRAFT_605254 [Pterula gracilis]
MADAELPPGVVMMPIPADIHVLTTAPFIGIMLNWLLMGILSVQLYIYHLNFYGRDRKVLQALAYGLFIIDLVQTGLATWDGFEWFVLGWGNAERLLIPFSAPVNSPLFDAVTALLVQGYYCWRIYILSRVKWWPALLLLLTFLQAASGVASGVVAALANDFRLIHDRVLVVGTIFMGTAALVDTLIAITTTYLLLRRSENRHHQVDFMITKIVRMIVETNTLTASVALVALVAFVKFPANNYFLCPLYILGKLYTISLLVMFNTRIFLNRTPNASEGTGPHFRSTGASSNNGRQGPNPNMFVRVEKSTLSDAIPLSTLDVSDATPTSAPVFREHKDFHDPYSNSQSQSLDSDKLSNHV